MRTQNGSVRWLAALAGGSLILGCMDGKLDVLEPIAQGGSGGSSGAAGSAGTGNAAASPFVLDDFEDGDTQSLGIPGGYWYFKPDPTCSGSFVIELTSGHAGATHAIRARGGNCNDWGALLGLDLRGEADTFDASSFDELRFWARVEPASYGELSVSLLDPSHFDAAIDVTSTWQEFVLPLDDFVFTGDGAARPLAPSALTHLQFFVFSSASFDFWLDDIAFVRAD